MSTNNSITRIATYGSLRVGEYNNRRDMKHISTNVINGYKLYGLWSYPGINESLNNEPLVVDVFDCEESTKRGIDAMELGAGYRIKEIEIDGEKCHLYIHLGDANNHSIVEHGDWCYHRSGTISKIGPSGNQNEFYNIETLTVDPITLSNAKKAKETVVTTGVSESID